MELRTLKTRIEALHEPGHADGGDLAACRNRQRQLQERLAAFPDPHNNLENASKVVQYYVKSMLAGLYQGNAQWQIGYGPGWTRSNVAFAVMTHFLEDRPPLADIWPANELIWGGVFANPRFLTDEVRKLPRAGRAFRRDGACRHPTTGPTTRPRWPWSGASRERRTTSSTRRARSPSTPAA